MSATLTASAPQPLSGARVLRRYANRKIYDPYQSRYVNHAEIAELVRSGSPVKVLDRRTARDVTVLALARILSLEGERAHGSRQEALLGLVRAAPRGEPVATREARGGEPRRPAERASAADRAVRVVDELLCSGQRGAFVARRLLADQLTAIELLEGRARERGEEAAAVVASLRAVRGQLERVARRVERLDERLREAERA